MPTRLWLWLVICAVLIGGWVGWRSYGSLLQYRSQAHGMFVDQFQNGIRGALSYTLEAKRLSMQGNAALAGTRMAEGASQLQSAWLGAVGMDLRSRGHLWNLEVLTAYQQQMSMLREGLAGGGDVQIRFDNLTHDLTVLAAIMGDSKQRDWLVRASADDLRTEFQSWREQALIKPDQP